MKINPKEYNCKQLCNMYSHNLEMICRMHEEEKKVPKELNAIFYKLENECKRRSKMRGYSFFLDYVSDVKNEVIK